MSSARRKKIESRLSEYISFMKQQNKPITKLYLDKKDKADLDKEIAKETAGSVFEKTKYDEFEGYPVVST